MNQAEAKQLKLHDLVEMPSDSGQVVTITPSTIHIRWRDGMKTVHTFNDLGHVKKAGELQALL